MNASPPESIYASRRARVLASLGDDGALILSASPELTVGADTDVRYLPDPDLYYLTGYVEPECVLVLCPSAEHPFTLFVRPRDPARERWTGARGGVERARDIADDARPVSDLAARLPELLAGAASIYMPFTGMQGAVEAAVRSALQQSASGRPRTGRGARSIVDARALLAPMRLIKDAHEIALMRRAADITVSAFRDLARGLQRMRYEYEAEAAIEYAFRSRGALGPAFPSIVAAGANATVLHYTGNNAPLARDALLLVDAGARADMYCADVSRTFPVSGRFTDAQRDLYDVVHAAHRAACACVGPGRSAGELEDAALRVLTDGMVALGLLAGSVDTLLEEKAYRRYFPHRVSHWLGLDVHDAGDYVLGGEPLRLAPGMVLTVEPGIYVPAEDDAAHPALRGTGIRLEDDLLVTDTGADVLPEGLELAADEVEALMAGSA